MTVPALSDTPQPKPCKQRAKSIQKNESAATRALKLVDDEPANLRYACGICGTRSTTPEHELCTARQKENGGR
jgi:hypothetical protein